MDLLKLLPIAMAMSLAGVPAGAQGSGEPFIAEAGPAIELKISIDPRARDIPGLIEVIEEDATALAGEHRELAAGDHAERGGDPRWMPHTLDAAYEVAFANERVASVVSTRRSYIGEPEGSQDFHTLTLDLADGELLGVEALIDGFAAGAEAFESIQAYVRDRLAFERAARLGLPDLPPEDLDWVHEGTASPGDLSQFALYAEEDGGGGIASGLKLFFPPYQVGSREEGAYVIEVPALVFSAYVAGEYRSLFDVSS